MEGERIDQRVPFPPQADGNSARVVAEPDAPSHRVPCAADPTDPEYRPVRTRRLDDNRQVVDIGANINGWVRAQRLGTWTGR